MPLRELATKILAQEGKPLAPDARIPTFHMTPFEPVKRMKGVSIRFLLSGPDGPLPQGVYVETDSISPVRFEASPKRIIRAIERHINAGVKKRKRKGTQINRNDNKRWLIKKCRFPSSYSPLGFLMFKVVPEGIIES